MKASVATSSKILDSAFALAILTSVLYFLGIANERGEASGLGIPHAFVGKEIWETVTYGADGALISIVFLPLTLFNQTGIKWWTVTLVLVTVVGAVALFRWLRGSRYRNIALAAWLIPALHLHIFAHSTSSMQDKVRNSVLCLQGQGCAAARVPSRVVFLESKDATKERSGMLLTMNKTYLILITTDGLLVVPVGSIRSIETVKPWPVR